MSNENCNNNEIFVESNFNIEENFNGNDEFFEVVEEGNKQQNETIQTGITENKHLKLDQRNVNDIKITNPLEKHIEIDKLKEKDILNDDFKQISFTDLKQMESKSEVNEDNNYIKNLINDKGNSSKLQSVMKSIKLTPPKWAER